MIYLSAADLLYIARRVVEAEVLVRDFGLLHSASERPRAKIGGVDAYPSLEHKAAALTHSILQNYALVDGNKRLALAALIAMLGINGLRLVMSNDEAHAFIVGIASGMNSDLEQITEKIRARTTQF